jgi:2-polyprenyl-3-methyl-5-hydroxy-6-metoxy-1,4-benzoquinol methylase
MSRDYNKEYQKFNKLKYYYNFDLLMHDYMIDTFKNNFIEGEALEIGCGNGNFTNKIKKFFKKITVVEASSDFAKRLKKNIKKITIVNSTFEKFSTQKKFDNIFLIHTLEHVADRKKFLKKARSYLSKKGKLFIVVPNADAASRLIAVNMGLIKKKTSITKKEKKHGHVITFESSSLKENILKAKLKIIKHGGIFFKSLANFQIDDCIKNKIINKKFLDACYELGKFYPKFCSSIYCITKR